MAEITGLGALNRRLNAIKDTRGILRNLQNATTRNAKKLSPVKTGNLRRTIRPGYLSGSEAWVNANAAYAAYVEKGTRAHDIRPRNAKALRFPTRGTPVTLAGRVRSSHANRPGSYAFAKRVHHPGTKPQPFLLPGAKQAAEEGGLGEYIVSEWNGAA